jgi:hypothetical protein
MGQVLEADRQASARGAKLALRHGRCHRNEGQTGKFTDQAIPRHHTAKRNGELVSPDFDDSKWTQGKAPIGKGRLETQRNHWNKYSSTWGKEEFLLMRSTFEVDNLDYDSYRIAILARQGFHVYLNGHKIHTYIWWQDKPQYGSIVLDKEQIQHLKKGKNVLAVYANDQYSSESSPEHYAGLDAWIEGITKADQKKLDLALEEVLSPKDREALKGASNGGYHYPSAVL